MQIMCFLNMKGEHCEKGNNPQPSNRTLNEIKCLTQFYIFILYMMQFDCHVSSDAILLDLKCHLVAVLSVC